ncbi:hypothetical protein BJ170DRAFT_589556 [Xylariales sp. AK1849]|nr:hypothetical protein BJ170DRAFT_589556 [Xylariales sp. AK1849]
MMTREHHRRRSPESSRRRRKERRDSREQLAQTQQIPVAAPYEMQRYETPQMRSRVLSTSESSSSSSTSSSLLDISRKEPRKFGLQSFFSGSEQSSRHQRRVRKKRSRRMFRFGNSSSSSVNSDLAYGKGYIDRRRTSRDFTPPKQHKPRRDGSDLERPHPPKRAQTDEEIIELGRKFAEIARQQNHEDMRAAGRHRPSTLVGAATALSQFHRTNSGPHLDRGIGGSRPSHGSPDDSEWESASEDESSSEEDSGLAYGSTVHLPTGAHHELHISSPPIPSQPVEYGRMLQHKPSIVDPRLFGPHNSLRGHVHTPCGFDKVDRKTLRDNYEPSAAPRPNASIAPSDSYEARPLQTVYAVPTSDPNVFRAGRGSVISVEQGPSRSRPAPVPIQQPKPIAPVFSKVFDTMETDPKYPRRTSSSGSALVGAAAVGLAGAALAGALDRKDDRKDDREKYRDERRDRERDEKRRSKHSDSKYGDEGDEKRRSKDPVSKYADERDEKRQSRDDYRDDRHERRREKEKEKEKVKEKLKRDPDADRDYEREKRRRDKYRDDEQGRQREHRDRPKDETKEDRKSDRKSDRKEDRKDERREEKRVSRSSTADAYRRIEDPSFPSSKGPIDPFQFQVEDDAFATPQYTTPKRPLTPMVVTVDREPNFSSFEVKENDVKPPERMSRRDSYERELRDTKDVYDHVYDLTKESTAPIGAAAIAAATAALAAEERGRGRSRSRGGDASSRNRADFDPVQDEADRAYRRDLLARQAEEDRSRSASREPSVVDKWKDEPDSTVPEIVAPSAPFAEKEEKSEKKSPYDGPDADVRIDNVLTPRDLPIRSLGRNGRMPKSRDPSAERDRPMLNLVRPTPASTPIPEKQRAREEASRDSTRESKKKPKPQIDTSGSFSDDVVIGPRGEIIQTPATPSSKAVSWGENETRRYVVESPERGGGDQSGTRVVIPAETPKPKSGKKSGWGAITAAIAGAGAGAAAAAAATTVSDASRDKDETSSNISSSRKSRDSPKGKRNSSAPWDEEYDEPPVPGPKPSSPRSREMPGTFSEDPDFTATVAAGLQDSGFDPDLVINNVKYHKRDSPPGSNEPFEPRVYHAPFADTVTDLGILPVEGPSSSKVGSDHGFVIGELPATPADEKDISTDKSDYSKLSKKERKKLEKTAKRDSVDRSEIEVVEESETPQPVAEDDEWMSTAKLSKKEQKKRDKAARAKALQDEEVIEIASPRESEPETPQPIPEDDEWTSSTKPSKKEQKKRDKAAKAKTWQDEDEVVEIATLKEPEPVESTAADEWEDNSSQKKKSKKSKNKAIVVQEDVKELDDAESSSKVSVPVDAFRDLQDEKSTEPQDAWGIPKKSKKSKRDSGAYDTPSRSAVPSEELESSKRAAEDEPTPAPDDEWDIPTKKSKKKSSKRDSIATDTTEWSTVPSVVSESVNRTRTVDDDFTAVEPTSVDDWNAPMSKKSKKKSKRDSTTYDSPSQTPLPADDIVESPKEMSESFSDLRSDKSGAPLDDDWNTPKKSKKKSKRDSEIYDSPSGSRSASRSAAPSEVSRTESFKKKSKRDSHHDSPSRSAPASEVGSEVSERKSKKDKHRSAPGSFPEDNDATEMRDPPPERRRSFDFQDNDVSSVVSGPSRYDDLRRSEKRRSRSRFDDDDTKSVASAPGGSRKESKSEKDKEKRNSAGPGLFDRFKSSIGIADEKDKSSRKSDEDKKQSFLDNAGTLGAGVGLAGAVAAVASQLTRPKATDVPSEEKEAHSIPTTPERRTSPVPQGRRGSDSIIDPEIVQREIRPAIDPQYGDLLPLPPSTPGSPTFETDELPALPDSRPETPERERQLLRETLNKPGHIRRRSAIDTPTKFKSPSQSAIPIQFRLKPRDRDSVPSSPGFRQISSPVSSPIVAPSETLSASRPRPPRPTSWDSTKEYKPLYLVEKTSRDPVLTPASVEEDLPQLPESGPPSRESQGPEFERREGDVQYRGARSLSNDLALKLDIPAALQEAQAAHLGSQETTPKANTMRQPGDDAFSTAADFEAKTDEPTLSPSFEHVAGIQSPNLAKPTSTREDFGSPKPEPIDPMSKNRSSYLLHSSPPSAHKTGEVEVIENSPTRSSPNRPSELTDFPESTNDEAKNSGALSAIAGMAAGAAAAAIAILPGHGQHLEDAKTPDAGLLSGDILAGKDDVLPESAGLSGPPESFQEDKDPAQFSFAPAKKFKKGKKSKKGKSVEVEEESIPVPLDETSQPQDEYRSSRDLAELIPETQALEDDSASVAVSEKRKKKDQKGKSFRVDEEPALVPVEETSLFQDEPGVSQYSVDSASKALPQDDDYAPVMTSKKGKKDRKTKKSPIWESESKVEESQTTDVPSAIEGQEHLTEEDPASLAESGDAQLETEPETSVLQRSESSFSKKGKKKKSKAFKWEPEPEIEESTKTTEEMPISLESQGLPPAEEPLVSFPDASEPVPEYEIKESTSIVEHKPSILESQRSFPRDEGLSQPMSEPRQPEAEPETSTLQRSLSSTSKKGKKKKGKISQVWGEPEPTSQEPDLSATETKDFGQDRDDTIAEAQPSPPAVEVSSHNAPEILSTIPREETQSAPLTDSSREISADVESPASTKPTPAGGPGSWPFTPATAEMKDNDTEYFPSSATMDSSNSEKAEPEKKSILSSAVSMLPAVGSFWGRGKKTDDQIQSNSKLQPISEESQLTKDTSDTQSSVVESVLPEELDPVRQPDVPAPDSTEIQVTARPDSSELSDLKLVESQLPEAADDTLLQPNPPSGEDQTQLDPGHSDPLTGPLSSVSNEDNSIDRSAQPPVTVDDSGPSSDVPGESGIASERNAAGDLFDWQHETGSKKKGKKDKKKRQSALGSWEPQSDVPFSDIEVIDDPLPRKVDLSEHSIESEPAGDDASMPIQQETEATADDIWSAPVKSGKKGKKGKKSRQSSQAIDYDDIGESSEKPVERAFVSAEDSKNAVQTEPESIIEPVASTSWADEIDAEETKPVEPEPEPQTESESTASKKKSKKDKKKRGSSQLDQGIGDMPSEQKETSVVPKEIPLDAPSTAESGPDATEDRGIDQPSLELDNLDDAWSAPTPKKSKKDKKKRGSSQFVEGINEVPSVGLESPITTEQTPVDVPVATELEPDVSRDPGIDPPTLRKETVDDELWPTATSKKSKKKRQSLQWQESAESTVNPNLPAEDSSKPEEDFYGFTSSKKSKKDKKKRKSVTFADSLEENLLASPTESFEDTRFTHEPVNTTSEGTADSTPVEKFTDVDPSSSSGLFHTEAVADSTLASVLPDQSEPSALAEGPQMPDGHKDDMDQSITEPAMTSQSDLDISYGSSKPRDLAGSEVLPQSTESPKPPPEHVDNAKSEQQVDAADPHITEDVMLENLSNQDVSTVSAEENFPIVAMKSKNDKKMRKNKAEDPFESTSGTSTPMEEAIPDTLSPENVDALTAPSFSQSEPQLEKAVSDITVMGEPNPVSIVGQQQQDDEFSSFTTKKSKKEKKKKRGSQIQETLSESEQAHLEEPQAGRPPSPKSFASGANTTGPIYPETQDIVEEPAIASEQPLEAQGDEEFTASTPDAQGTEEFAAFTTKKSKKDKKKKRNSQIQEPQAPQSDFDEMLADWPGPSDEAGLTSTLLASGLEDTVAESTVPLEQPSELHEDGASGFTSKKSKKDKKKKRASQVQDWEPTAVPSNEHPFERALSPSSESSKPVDGELPASQAMSVEESQPPAHLSSDHEQPESIATIANNPTSDVQLPEKSEIKKTPLGEITRVDNEEIISDRHLQTRGYSQLDTDIQSIDVPPKSPVLGQDLVPNVDAAEEDLSQFFPTSKSKKDKKKKKRDSQIILEESSAVPAEDITAPVQGSEKNQELDVSQSELRDANSQLPELVSREISDPIPVTEEGPQVLPESEPLSTKKSKKDKKTNRGSAWADDLQGDQSETPSAVAANEQLEDISPPPVEAFKNEEVDNFVPAKNSKKDKKKKQRASTWDDDIQQEQPLESPVVDESGNVTSEAISEPPQAETAVPLASSKDEDFLNFTSSKKSKKDKKKKRASTWDVQEPQDLPAPLDESRDLDLETEQQGIIGTAPSLGNSNAEDFSSFTPSKKDKKKKRSSTWEPEPELKTDISPTALKIPELVPESELPSFHSGSDKQSTSSLTGELHSTQPFQEIVEEQPLPQNPISKADSLLARSMELDNVRESHPQLDEIATSQIIDNPSGHHLQNQEPVISSTFEEQALSQKPELVQPTEEAVIDPIVEENVLSQAPEPSQLTSEDPIIAFTSEREASSQEPIPVQPLEQEIQQDEAESFVIKKSKKDKKKKRASQVQDWEPESSATTPLGEPYLPIESTPVEGKAVDDDEKLEDVFPEFVSNGKSKKDKKKRTSQVQDWEPESSVATPIDEIQASQIASEEMPLRVESVPQEIERNVDDVAPASKDLENAEAVFPEFVSSKKSKKYKKKKRGQAQVGWEPESTYATPLEQPQPILDPLPENSVESGVHPATEDIASLPLGPGDSENTFPESISSKKSKKDRKNKKAQVDWEPDVFATPLEEPQPIQESLTEILGQETFMEGETQPFTEDGTAASQGDQDPENVFPESVSSKKSKKDKRNSNKVAGVLPEPDAEVGHGDQEQIVDPLVSRAVELSTQIPAASPVEAHAPVQTKLLSSLQQVVDGSEAEVLPQSQKPSDIVDNTQQRDTQPVSPLGSISHPAVDSEIDLIKSTADNNVMDSVLPPQDLATSIRQDDQSAQTEESAKDVPSESVPDLAIGTPQDDINEFPGFSLKKSKKDKKKARQSKALETFALENDQVTTNPIGSEDPSTSEIPKEDVLATERVAGAAPLSDLSRGESLALPTQSDELSSRLTEVLDVLPQPEMISEEATGSEPSNSKDIEEELSPITRKKSKKDKKKQKTGTLLDSEPTSGTQTPLAQENWSEDMATSEPLQLETQGTGTNELVEDAPAHEPLELDIGGKTITEEPEPDTHVAEDWPEYATKKSKKDKKKRKSSAQVDSGPASGVQTPSIEEIQPRGDFGDDVAAWEPTDPVVSQRIIAEEPASTLPPVDDWPEHTTKKSKKDKKKRKSAAFADSEPTSGTQTPLVQDLNQDKELARSVPNLLPLASEVTQSFGTEKSDPIVGAEDEWSGYTAKKSKKDKKKRESAGFPDPQPSSETETSLAPDAIQVEILDKGGPALLPTYPEVTQSFLTEMPETKAPLDDAWSGYTAKMSKKDKKKRKASGTSTPLEASLPDGETTQEDTPQTTSKQEPGVFQGKDVWDDDDFFQPKVSTPGDGSVADTHRRESLQDHSPPVISPEVDVDLSPAQLTSNIDHEPPFDQSIQPGKKARMQSFLGDTMIPEPISATREFAASYLEDPSQRHESPDSTAVPRVVLDNDFQETNAPRLPSVARDIATSYLESQPVHEEVSQQREESLERPGGLTNSMPDITPNREIAVSYFESQPKDFEEHVRPAEEQGQGPEVGNHDLPAITPRRELAASYFDPEPAAQEDIPKEDILPEVPLKSAEFTDMTEDESQLSQQDTQAARDVAADLMEFRPGKSKKSGKSSPKKEEAEKVEEDESKDVKALAAARALTGGVAMMAERFGGSKKAKGKGKKKSKYVDKRAPKEDDIFDDPSLWESSERKTGVEEGGRLDADTGDFWDVPSEVEDDPVPSSALDVQEMGSKNEQARSTAQELLPESPGSLESPIVGRQVKPEVKQCGSPSEHAPAHESSIQPGDMSSSEFMRDLEDLDTSEPPQERDLERGPTGPSLYESHQHGVLPSPRDLADWGRGSTLSARSLPPVEEETNEDLEEEFHGKPRSRDVLHTPETNRDSGFITDSPHPTRRSLFDDSEHRDSGVHMRDWPEGTPKRREGLSHFDETGARLSWESTDSNLHTPKTEERKLGKSPLGDETPRLSTPRRSLRDKTPEPEKRVESHSSDAKGSRSSKYQNLGAGTGPALTPTHAYGQRSISDDISREGSPRAGSQARRSASNSGISRLRTPEPLNLRPESPGSLRSSSGTNTPPLRRVDKRVSGDLRSLSQHGGSHTSLHSNSNSNFISKDVAAEREQLAERRAASTTTPVANEGRVRARDMTDVYDGLGEGRIGSPRSPTRPHSMRRRQSMQVLELESKVEQLIAENRMLAEARVQAESSVNQRTVVTITERDVLIEELRASLDEYKREVERLKEVNEGLHSANAQLAHQHNEKYRQLETQHTSTSQELEQFRGVRGNYTRTLEEKDAEIQQLRDELQATKEQVREMQRQILATKPADAEFLRLKDEDHFDHRCQQLCAHVQQWVLRFSKFSDMRACRLTSEINDEKIIDRLDNTVLDGSEVDDYLSDRVKRRDIFMSMTMNMIWEYVFTRYLFGMDREQRQKLKSLEKLLSEVGPPNAVRQWRAVTLTLLSRRPAFGNLRNEDTEAVVQAILHTLTMILPPPSNMENQIQSQLRKVLREAVDLSIEMRTQRAEYMMLPPLQPEYDGNGDLAETVTFNASIMNERSGNSTSNEDLEADGAIVRTVLFPLIVKKGDDDGVGDDEIVVCPAQVLVAEPSSRSIRMFTPSSDFGGAPLSRGATPSVISKSAVSLPMSPGSQPEAEYLEGGI